MERNLIGDDLVFSAARLKATVASLWKVALAVRRSGKTAQRHGVFTRVVNTRLRLSAYSSRKIAAFNLMSAGGEQGLLVASEMLGHSKLAITRTYLQLGARPWLSRHASLWR